MKNIKIIFILTLIFTLTFIPTYASDDIEVRIDGNKISFNTEPEMYGNTIMVPMKEFFEAMGARVLWVEEERMVIAYKDNMHMKLQLGNKVAFRNGKRFALETEPYIREGHTLVPIQIIAETFNMKPEWDKENGILQLEGSGSDAGLKLFNDGIYKTKPINELGITISIPYHWGKLDGPFQYGYQDDFESYSVTLMSQPIEESLTLSDLVDENKALLLNAYDENIIFTGEEEMEIDNLLKVRKLYITTTVNEAPQKQVLYVLKQDDKAYFMTSHYGIEVPEEDIIEVFDNVMSTFKIRNLSIDSEEEHYMEFEDFYNANVQLNQEFYSNMVVEKSEIPFSGTLKDGHDLESFRVKVTSDREALEFIIPVNGNAFDGTIYTPFGLGKHNIFISGIKKNPGPDDSEDTIESPTITETPENPETEPTENTSESGPENESENESEHESESKSEVDSEVDSVADSEAGPVNSSIINDSSEIVVTENSADDNTDEVIDTAQDAETDSTTTTITADDSQSKSEDTVDPVDEVIEASNTDINQIQIYDPSELPLMQFSIINIDSRTMRYRIPTNVINSNDSQVNSTSQLITYQVSNQYMKAKELYDWILKNIAIESMDAQPGPAKTNIQVFDSAIGSSEEINQLYVAYLRALDIPSRVMKGTSTDKVYFWTELYLNGSWVVSDTIEGILLKNDDSSEFTQASLFNVNIETHRAKYDLIQIMPY